MKKVTQWFISEYPDRPVPMANNFPWKSISLQEWTKVYDDPRFEKFHRHGWCDNKHHSWQEFKKETEIKYIGEDYNTTSINIFVFQITHGFDRDQFFDCLDLNTIKWLQDHPCCAVVFLDVTEALDPTHVFDYLGWARTHYGLPNQFLWLNNNLNAESIPTPDWLELKGHLHCLQWIFYLHHGVQQIPTCDTKALELEKTFLLYGGRHRYERQLLVDRFRTIPLDKMYCKINWDPKINNLPVKDDDDDYRRSTFRYMPHPEHYKRIFVDLVIETYNEHTTGVDFITEKVAKPMHCYRPFVVSANTGYYQHLKRLGFKTFDRWWDESFDEELEFVSHIDKLMETVKQIEFWDQAKIHQTYDEMLPILEHNRQVLDDFVYNQPRSWIDSVRNCAYFRKQ